MKTGKLLMLTVALLAIAGPLSACVPPITQTEPPTVPTPSSTISAPSPAATPTLDRAGDDVVLLTWHREGGIAGFCDDLVVYADGQVVISSCKDSQPRVQKSLSGEQMEQLRRWVETYQSFEFEQRDEAVADGMAIRMTFVGKGSQEATEADKQAMLAFAATLASSAPVPTATPQPTNTPPATATVAPTTTSTPTALPLSRTIPSEEVRELRITIVYDNNAYDARLGAAWGFAALIEYGEHVLLFDTGGDGPTLMGNMAKLGLDPQAIQVVVLSHIHGDHVGGLQALLDTGVRPTVYVPASFPSSFKRSVRGRTPLVEVSESTQILSGIYSTGELGVSIIEQALVVETGEGTVVMTGCAHPGITKIVRVAKEIVPGEVALVIGGFHLAQAGQRSIERIIDRFLESDVRRVSPTHCTGERAMAMFADVYGEAYVEGGVGRVITIGGGFLPPLPAPTSTPTPLPVSVYLEPMNHQWQTHNNCGPASIAIVLGYYGHSIAQHQVNEEIPRGIRGIEEYVSQYDLMAPAYASPPAREPVRLLLANGIPVIVGQRLSREEDIGHFRVVHGYDDMTREFILDDPLLGPNLRIPYSTFSWLSNPGRVVPVYPAEMDPLVRSLVKGLRMREAPA